MNMKVRDIQKILDAEVLSGEDKLDVEVKYVGSADMISDILSLVEPGTLILTGYTYSQVIRTALIADLLGLVIVRGKYIPPETIELARQNNFLLMSTRGFMYSSCGKLYTLGLRGIDEKKP